jgi:hypothetical protein
LLRQALDLQPVGAPCGAIGRVAPLRDDALESEPARLREKLGAGPNDVVAVSEHRGLVIGRGKQTRERRLAVLEPRAREIAAVEVQQIEDHAGEPAAPRTRHEILKRLKAAGAVGQQHGDLTVEDRLLGREARDRCGDVGKALGPVARVSAQELCPTMVEPGEHAIAIVLQLVKPAVALGRSLDERGKLGLNEFR